MKASRPHSKLLVLFLLLLVLVGIVDRHTGTTKSSEIHYTNKYSYRILYKGAAEIVQYHGNGRETRLVIPKSLRGNKVVSIGQ